MSLMMRDWENKKMGVERAHREKIAQMLRDGKTPQAIAEFCKYPLKLIEKVQKRNNFARTY